MNRRQRFPQLPTLQIWSLQEGLLLFSLSWALVLQPIHTDGFAFPDLPKQQRLIRPSINTKVARSSIPKSTRTTGLVLLQAINTNPSSSSPSGGGDENKSFFNFPFHFGANGKNQEIRPTTTIKNEIKQDTQQQQQQQQQQFIDSDTRRLLGLKNPSTSPTTELWKIRLQLMKPVSWVPLSFIVMCGAAASGNYHWFYNLPPFLGGGEAATGNAAAGMSFGFQEEGLKDAWLGLWTVILAGPFSEGFAQTINDWYDRDIDAINEPYRPIPAGTITPQQVWEQLVVLFVGGLSIAIGLDVATSHDFPIVTMIALLGYLVSYIYSAPPLKLKQNGWSGDIAIGLCYISFPWWCGLSVFGTMDRPVDWIVPLLYSMSGMGVAIVNDFKSMEGDEKFGLESIPLLLGVDRAKWLAAIIPDLTQLIVASYLYFGMHQQLAALFVLAVMVPQLYLQKTLLLEDPLKYDMEYMMKSQPWLLLGLTATALCIGQHDWSSKLIS